MKKIKYFFGNYYKYIFLNNHENDLYNIVFSSVLCGLIFASNFDIPLRSLDVSLVFNNLNIFSQESFTASWAIHSWSLIHQLGSAGLLLGLNHFQLSSIINIFTIIATILGINLFLFSFTKSIRFSTLCGCVLASSMFLPFLQSNYEPQGFGSPHLGAQGMSLVVLTFGLLAINKLGIGLLVSLVNVAVHPLFGLWGLFLFITNIIVIYAIQKKPIGNIYNIVICGIVGLFLVAISYIFQSNFFTQTKEINTQLYSTYLEIWDTHRCSAFSDCETAWYSIIFTILFIFGIYLIRKYIQQRKSEGYYSVFITVLVSLFIAVFIYFLGEVIFVNKLQELLVRIIHGRFMAFSPLLISIITIIIIREWFINDKEIYKINLPLFILFFVLLISILFAILIKFHTIIYFGLLISIISIIIAKKWLINNIAINLQFLILFSGVSILLLILRSSPLISAYAVIVCFINFLLISPFGNYILNLKYKKIVNKRILTLFIIFSTILFINLKLYNHKTDNSNNVCPNLKIEKPVLITNGETYNFAQRVCGFPALIDVTSFDGVPYMPWTADSLAKIVQIGYGINFNSPPIKNQASLNESDFKTIWENRDKKEWRAARDELNFSLIFVPIDWKLKLDLVFENNFKIYAIN